jgi:hypothetical protein
VLPPSSELSVKPAPMPAPTPPSAPPKVVEPKSDPDALMTGPDPAAKSAAVGVCAKRPPRPPALMSLRNPVPVPPSRLLVPLSSDTPLDTVLSEKLPSSFLVTFRSPPLATRAATASAE